MIYSQHMYHLEVLSHLRPRFVYSTSSVITGIRGAKGGRQPAAPPLYKYTRTYVQNIRYMRISYNVLHVRNGRGCRQIEAVDATVLPSTVHKKKRA